MCISPIDIRIKLDLQHQYCIQNVIEVNTSKTEILKFHNRRNKILSQPILYNNRSIDVVNKFNYLGVVFFGSGKLNIAVEENSKNGTLAAHESQSILCTGK